MGLHSSVDRGLHCYKCTSKGHKTESCWSPIVFMGICTAHCTLQGLTKLPVDTWVHVALKLFLPYTSLGWLFLLTCRWMRWPSVVWQEIYQSWTLGPMALFWVQPCIGFIAIIIIIIIQLWWLDLHSKKQPHYPMWISYSPPSHWIVPHLTIQLLLYNIPECIFHKRTLHLFI